MTQKEITFEGLQCHDYIFLSDYKYRFQNLQSGEWTVLTTKTYADEYEKMFTNGDPAKVELTEARRSLYQYLPHICMQLPMLFPWVDPDIPEVFDDFYMEDVWCDIMTYKSSVRAAHCVSLSENFAAKIQMSLMLQQRKLRGSKAPNLRIQVLLKLPSLLVKQEVQDYKLVILLLQVKRQQTQLEILYHFWQCH
ncbi:unnamed protein product [Bathycoccus prasinos]